jgi:hypothetical protein
VFVNSSVGPFVVFNTANGHCLAQQHRVFLGQVIVINVKNKICAMQPEDHRRLIIF